MQTIKLSFLSILLALTTAAHGKDLLLAKAPHIQLKTILQTGGKSLADLDGKVVVLEFWGTYCTPCLQNLAHLNSLSEHFADSNVQFISITHEDEQKITTFLQRRKMSGWVGIDSGHVTCKAYGVESYPRTFIIDKNGIIKYDGGPWDLNEGIIRDILSGNYIPVANTSKSDQIVLGSFAPGDDPVFTAHFDPKMVQYQQIIRKSVGTGGMGYRSGNGTAGIDIFNKNLPFIIANLDQIPSHLRVINQSSIPDTAKWDVIFLTKSSSDLDRAYRELHNRIEETFGLTIRDSIVPQLVSVPVYQVGPNIKHKDNINFDDPASHTQKCLQELFTNLEEKGGTIVDIPAGAESQYTDIFSIVSTYYKMTGTEIKEWLIQQGVTFKTEERFIKVAVITDQLASKR